MTFLAPIFFVAAAASAAVIVALHLLATKEPTVAPLPTIRFVPDRQVTAKTRAIRLADLLLLLLRMLILLAIGAALARPVLSSARVPMARIVALDLSRATGNLAAARDSARAYVRDQDVLVVFDSSTRVIANGARDSLTAAVAPNVPGAPGSLSGALVAALQQASELRERADSIELVIVSPFDREEMDAATTTIRAQWPGRARLVLLEGSTEPPRRSSTGAIWAGAERPERATARAVGGIDTVGAVAAGDEVVVAPFERRWEFPADSLAGARVLARWVDGRPAAIEWADGAECQRSSVVPRDTVGDLILRPDFDRLTRALTGPCGSTLRGTIPAPILALLAGPPDAAPAVAISPHERRTSPLTPWLLGGALALVGVEMFARRRGQGR